MRLNFAFAHQLDTTIFKHTQDFSSHHNEQVAKKERRRKKEERIDNIKLYILEEYKSLIL